MKVYINDKPIILEAFETFRENRAYYDLIMEDAHLLDEQKLIGKVLVYDNATEHLDILLSRMQKKKLKALEEVTLVSQDYEGLKKHFKSLFKVVKAAGGLVEKDNKVLMIKRFDKWDLPKGKLEKEEKSKEGALREVEEECNVKVKALEKICHTWHTYISDGLQNLKKTTWYRMQCLDDTNMLPQYSEGIMELKWMKEAEYTPSVAKSYGSIKDVFEHYKLLKESIKKG